MVASVKVVLYKSKTLSNGEHPVMLCISKNQNRRYLALGISCKVELWNTKESLPKKKHPLYEQLAAIINKAKTDASKEVLLFAVEDQEFSLRKLNSLSSKKNPEKLKVLAYFKQVEERLIKSGRIGYSKVFQYTHNSLRTFYSNSDFEFIEVNTSFLMRYEEWFLSRGVKPNSVFVFMRTFKTLINYARKEEIVKQGYDPFKDFGLSKYRRIKTVKRSISKEQIQSIATYTCKSNGYYFHARNYFMFSYYNRGINFIDIAHLRWSNINNSRLIYTRKKTKENFSIKLLEPSMAIINHYWQNRAHTQDDYIFPILDKSIHLSPQQIDNRVDKVIKNVNKALKKIGKELGIQEKLTTYVARHSFATVLKRSGTPVTIISELMGHDSEHTTKIYLADFENDVLDQATEALL